MTDRDDRYDQLDERLSRLEDRLQRLEQRLDAPDSPDRPEPGSPSRPSAERTDDDPTGWPDWLRIEGLVDKIGVALLLVGLAFLYRLSVERGWITPVVRIGFGVVLGSGLSAVGWYIRDRRRRLGQVLLGAGSVAFYITLYAAHHFYELLPYALTFGAMTAVVVATFVLANARRDAALAFVGAVGGFATPIMLSSDGNIPGLMTYTAILVSGMTAIYIVRGWRSVLTVTALGGWIFVAFASVALSEGVEQLHTQGGLLVVWFCVGAVPTIRTWLWTGQTDRPDLIPTRLTALLAVVSTLAGFGLTWIVWGEPDWLVVGVSPLLAATAAGAAQFLARRLSGPLVSAYRIVAALFAVLTLSEVVPDGHMIPVLAVVALVVHLVAARYHDRLLRHFGHLGALVVALEFIRNEGLAGSAPDLPFLTSGGLEGALVVACCFTVSMVVARHLDPGPYHRPEYLLYRWAAYGLAPLYIVFEARPFDYGSALISGAWGAYAVVLVVAGLVADHRELERAGLAAVLLTVGKLLFFDLATLDLLWRVLLFMGFGAALLAVGFYAPSLGAGGDTNQTED